MKFWQSLCKREPNFAVFFAYFNRIKTSNQSFNYVLLQYHAFRRNEKKHYSAKPSEYSGFLLEGFYLWETRFSNQQRFALCVHSWFNLTELTHLKLLSELSPLSMFFNHADGLPGIFVGRVSAAIVYVGGYVGSYRLYPWPSTLGGAWDSTMYTFCMSCPYATFHSSG